MHYGGQWAIGRLDKVILISLLLSVFVTPKPQLILYQVAVGVSRITENSKEIITVCTCECIII